MKCFCNKPVLYALGILLFSSISQACASDPFSDMGVDIPKVRLQAPVFSLASLDGSNTRLSDFRGKVVLLTFWATWCKPCRKEMPDMQALWKKFKNDGFVILAVAANTGERKQIELFTNRLGLTFPILLDPEGEVRNRYEVIGLPMSYFIGRDGKISGRIIGVRQWAGKEAESAVRALLEKVH